MPDNTPLLVETDDREPRNDTREDTDVDASSAEVSHDNTNNLGSESHNISEVQPEAKLSKTSNNNLIGNERRCTNTGFDEFQSIYQSQSVQPMKYADDEDIST